MKPLVTAIKGRAADPDITSCPGLSPKSDFLVVRTDQLVWTLAIVSVSPPTSRCGFLLLLSPEGAEVQTPLRRRVESIRSRDIQENATAGAPFW